MSQCRLPSAQWYGQKLVPPWNCWQQGLWIILRNRVMTSEKWHEALNATTKVASEDRIINRWYLQQRHTPNLHPFSLIPRFKEILHLSLPPRGWSEYCSYFCHNIWHEVWVVQWWHTMKSNKCDRTIKNQLWHICISKGRFGPGCCSLWDNAFSF